MEINDLVKEAYQTSENNGFHDPPPSFAECIALIHSELSEALEEYRDGYDPHTVYYGEGGKPEGIPAELADALIRIADTCGIFGIDLESAVATKMAFNKTRPYKHGKRM